MNEGNTAVARSDGSVIPWNTETGGPLGGGEVWRRWEEDGSPTPVAYTAPPPPLPTETALTRVQFKAILAILGVTIDQVNAAIDAAITDPVQNAVAKARVTDSENYQRENPLFALLGPSLGFTDAELDAAWPTALSI